MAVTHTQYEQATLYIAVHHAPDVGPQQPGLPHLLEPSSDQGDRVEAVAACHSATVVLPFAYSGAGTAPVMVKVTSPASTFYGKHAQGAA